MSGGAYGLSFAIPFAPGALLPAGPAWPLVALERAVGHVPVAPNVIDGEEARFHFAGEAGLRVDRASSRALFTSPTRLSDDELLHPFLAPVGAAFAWWAHREAFHAGAVVIDGRAWAIVGDKGAGKSTLLAALGTAGHPVVCDDMLVLADGMAFAGPRCVDLREPAAEQLGVGECTLRPPEPRWRVRLAPAPPVTPLAGWIFLAWGEEAGTAPIPASVLLPRLAANRSILVAPGDPAVLLDLAALPAWELRRPAEWSALSDSADRLVNLAASA